jgi:DNA-binding NtrC family response regulator
VAIVDLEDAPVASGFAAGLPQGAECTILAVAPRGLSSSAPDAVPGAARDIIVRPVDAPELVWRVQRLLAQAGTRGRALGARPVLLETHNAAMREALDLLHRLAATDKTVLLRGETGTGKEVLARTLHDWSERRERPFLAVNCAAIPDSLLATELYGHERGAFTGALRTKRGLVELAKGGTLFLDEIGELSPAMQAALLRVLQEGEFMRVGGEEVLRSDVRIVAATHRDLEEMVAKSLFREDLYYRIQIVPIHVPALRERPEDLRALADFVARRSAEEQHTPERRFTPAAYAELERHSWPGNIRELENVVARALLLSTGPEIDWIKLDRDRRPLSAPPPARAPADREALVDLIRQHQGNIKAAAAAGRIPRRTFYRRLQALGIEPQSLRRNG